MNRVPHCSKCDCMRMYDYSNRIYYCDHEDKIDDMGKLSVDHPPKTSLEWCPLRCGSDDNSFDFIKMQSDIQLTDKDGYSIELKSFQPEYLART